MKGAAIALMLLLSIISTTKLSYGGSITYGPTIDVSGGLKLVDSALCFADGSCQTTAVFSDGSAIWGQITGYIDNQIDLSVKFDTKEDKISKNQINGYAGLDAAGKISLSQLPPATTVIPLSILIPVVGTTPVWHSQGAIWESIPGYTKLLTFVDPKILRVRLTDNIGINGGKWCNLGIFVDDSSTPVCGASWFGNPYSMSFRQETFFCYLGLMNIGEHTISVKHRSENCTYGNYWLDEHSVVRELYLEVF